MAGVPIPIRQSLEAVRRRPGMYVAQDESGLHDLAWHVVERCLSEVRRGLCRRIDLTVHTDGALTVKDDGQGMEPKTDARANQPTCEYAMTTLFVGKPDAEAVRNGVGLAVVTFLSEFLELQTCRDGQLWTQRFERGAKTTDLASGGPTEQRGTRICFKPDPTIFGNSRFDSSRISDRMREHAVLNAGLTVSITDERTGVRHEWRYEDGLSSFVESLSKDRVLLHPKPLHFVTTGATSWVERVEVALQFVRGGDDQIVSFANDVRTREGGVHVEGLHRGLTHALWTYRNNHALADQPSGQVRIVAAVWVMHTRPSFDEVVKDKLINPDLPGVVAYLVAPIVAGLFEQDGEAARVICLGYQWHVPQ